MSMKLSRRGQSALLDRYTEYVAKWVADGKPVLTIEPACGCSGFPVPVPTDPEEQWDSLSTCPHCGALSMHIKTHDSARSVVPEGVELEA